MLRLELESALAPTLSEIARLRSADAGAAREHRARLATALVAQQTCQSQAIKWLSNGLEQVRDLEVQMAVPVADYSSRLVAFPHPASLDISSMLVFKAACHCAAWLTSPKRVAFEGLCAGCEVQLAPCRAVFERARPLRCTAGPPALPCGIPCRIKCLDLGLSPCDCCRMSGSQERFDAESSIGRAGPREQLALRMTFTAPLRPCAPARRPLAHLLVPRCTS